MSLMLAPRKCLTFLALNLANAADSTQYHFLRRREKEKVVRYILQAEISPDLKLKGSPTP